MSTNQESGFHIAPFGFDGCQVGFGFWESSRLSGRWLGVCSEFLQAHGPVFDAIWPGELAHIRTKLTSASGAAIATFAVRDKIVASLLLLSGRSLEAERAIEAMFVDSLRTTKWTQAAGTTPYPFATIASINERPLMVVIAWPDATTAEQDYDLVRELGLQLAGAFFSANAEH